jgi:hypothetical protein
MVNIAKFQETLGISIGNNIGKVGTENTFVYVYNIFI